MKQAPLKYEMGIGMDEPRKVAFESLADAMGVKYSHLGRILITEGLQKYGVWPPKDAVKAESP
jgi:hypothetical protein